MLPLSTWTGAGSGSGLGLAGAIDFGYFGHRAHRSPVRYILEVPKSETSLDGQGLCRLALVVAAVKGT